MEKRTDFLALISNGWDLFYALAAIEARYRSTYCYSHAKFLERLVVPEKQFDVPKWVDEPYFYSERAEELQAKQKLYEQLSDEKKAKNPPKRVLLMSDDLAEHRRIKDLIAGRKRRMQTLVNKIKAKGAHKEADEVEHFMTKLIENPIGKTVDLMT